MTRSVAIHSTAEVSSKSIIGDGTSIWHHAQVREGAVIGQDCIIGKGVYVGADVHLGNRVKIQNYVSVYEGVTLHDGVMVGPHVCFTNDLLPRAINPDGTLKGGTDWELVKTVVHEGAGLGANSTIRCGVKIGRWALVGSGSVVTRDVPAYGLVYGNPARLHGFVCSHGYRLNKAGEDGDFILATTDQCDETIQIPKTDWSKLK